MKRVATLGLLVALILCLATSPVEASSHKLVVNGEEVALTQEIKVVNGRSMLPIRDFFQSLGAVVHWDGGANEVQVTKGHIKATFPVSAKFVYVNGHKVATDTPTQLIDSLVYIPIRIAGEVLEYKVDYRNGTITMTEDPVAVAARKHYDTFRDFLQRALQEKDVLVDIKAEYFALVDKLAAVEERAYVSKRGYTLYAPQEAYEYDLLWQAMDANARLYTDVLKGNVRSNPNFYYSEHPTVPMLNKDSDWVKFKSVDYDHDAVIRTLEGLDVPDILLRGTKVFMFPGKTTHFAGLARPTTDFGTAACVYVGNTSMENILGTLCHEVGHSIENVLSLNMPDFKQSYANLYGREVPDDSKVKWGDRLGENFAEDFERYCLGNTKTSNWTGVSREDFAEFLRAQAASFTPTRLMYSKASLLFPDGRQIRLDCPFIFLKFVLLPMEECVLEVQNPTLKPTAFHTNLQRYLFVGNKVRFRPVMDSRIGTIEHEGQAREMQIVYIGVEY